MLSQKVIESVIEFLVNFATDILLPVMVTAFFVAVTLRVLVYFTVKRSHWFIWEFEKRVGKFLEEKEKDDKREPMSFYVTLKRLLEKTFYETFEVRAILKRRRPDIIMTMGDRLFLIQQGSAWFVRDTLKRARHFRKQDGQPKLLQLAKSVYQNNPCFNRVLGFVPSSNLTDLLNILPGVFVIAGIFGTFLGIMHALPALEGMNPGNVEQAKAVMDEFLKQVSFAMSTSIAGILLSVTMNFLNTLLSPERVFIETVDRYENTLDLLWNMSDNNDLPLQIADFDEHRDPLEALAEESLNKEIRKGIKNRNSDLEKIKPTVKDAS